MARYYKLIDAVQTKATLNVARSREGIIVYEHVVLYPGELYELGTDSLFVRSLQNARIERKYSKLLSEELDALKINYTAKSCKSCGGKIKKISYSVIEFLEK